MSKTIISVTFEGREYMYKANNGIEVPKSRAEEICKLLNEKKYGALDGGRIWAVHEVDEYDNAYHLTNRKAYFYKGVLKVRFI